MRMVAPISPVTADRFCCWSMAGNDGARLTPSEPAQYRAHPHGHCVDRAVQGLSKRATTLDGACSPRPGGPTLRHQRQPIPHRAC